MITIEFSNSRILLRMRLLFSRFILIALAFLPNRSFAHQTPTTIVLLDVTPRNVAMELQLPLSELDLAFGHDLMKNPETIVDRLNAQLKEYLKAHIHPYVAKDQPWLVSITSLRMDKGEQEASGPPYWEIVAQLTLTPQPNESTRRFFLDYDVIMHQVINHAAFVSIRNDWETGHTGREPAQAGVIRWDLQDNVIYPLKINLAQGSWWKGFQNMVALGMQHIKEGTDHLLFLLVLLLPSMLLVNGNRWGRFGGTRYSITHLLKIVTAFTIGHSVTLLIGAMEILKLPARPVEILIAFSILVSAIHALRPIFPGKETYVAAGFGLIHGLAFASILANLHLSGGAMALSILGFNLGIEVMQLIVVAFIIPWLIMLSRTWFYRIVRITGACFAGIAALAWIIERYTNQSNAITSIVGKIVASAPWIIFSLALMAIVSFFWRRSKDATIAIP